MNKDYNESSLFMMIMTYDIIIRIFPNIICGYIFRFFLKCQYYLIFLMKLLSKIFMEWRWKTGKKFFFLLCFMENISVLFTSCTNLMRKSLQKEEIQIPVFEYRVLGLNDDKYTPHHNQWCIYLNRWFIWYSGEIEEKHKTAFYCHKFWFVVFFFLVVLVIYWWYSSVSS